MYTNCENNSEWIALKLLLSYLTHLCSWLALKDFFTPYLLGLLMLFLTNLAVLDYTFKIFFNKFVQN